MTLLVSVVWVSNLIYRLHLIAHLVIDGLDGLVDWCVLMKYSVMNRARPLHVHCNKW